MFKFNVFLGALFSIIAITLAQSDDSATLNRDRLVGVLLTEMGKSLQCLEKVYDSIVSQKIYSAWDGNLDWVQAQAIMEQTDDQYMDMVKANALYTLDVLRSIDSACGNQVHGGCKLPYTEPSGKLEVPEEVKTLRDNLIDIGGAIKCLLGNGQVDPRIHTVFSKVFKDYHGTTDGSATSLQVTVDETSDLLKDLKALDANC